MSEFKVVVEQALGDARFLVKTMKGEQLICHIPGKFKGHRKRKNFVEKDQIILVQTRTTKICDFISIVSQSAKKDFYEPDIQQIKIIPQIMPPNEDIDINDI